MEPVYTIALNKEQAQTLMIILEHIAGNPDTSSRKYAQDVYNMLYYDMKNNEYMRDVWGFEHVNGTIYFEDVLKG